jgi:hypothetical protein
VLQRRITKRPHRPAPNCEAIPRKTALAPFCLKRSALFGTQRHLAAEGRAGLATWGVYVSRVVTILALLFVVSAAMWRFSRPADLSFRDALVLPISHPASSDFAAASFRPPPFLSRESRSRGG